MRTPKASISKQHKKPPAKKKLLAGMPVAMLISTLIHVGLFLLAGMLVVFTVVRHKEIEFEPPKAVERPKMKLKKPKVKVKKSSKPKPTARIVTKVQKASMPDIQLPEMSGITGGLAGGIGGFDLIPNLDQITMFGSGQSVGNDLQGTFYDFNRNRKGKPLVAGMDRDKYKQELMKFLRNGWKPSAFSRYYRSPNKLYATTVMIPPVLSSEAPAAFNEPESEGWLWAVHYKGELVYPKDITFRFWGFGDDIMFVRVNGEIVLAACYASTSGNSSDAYFSSLWTTPDKANSRKYYLGNNKSVVGDWIALKAGEPVDMEVLIGEDPGGVYCAMLLVEVEGKEYPRNRQGGPILPIFKTAYPSLDLQDVIYKDLVPNEACVTNGPVFSDYDTGIQAAINKTEKTNLLSTNSGQKEPESGMRTWTFSDGNTLEAEFVAVIGGKVVLKNSRERQKKFPLGQFSEEDRKFIELSRPPKFNIDFSPTTSSWSLKDSPWFENHRPTPVMTDYTFTTKLKQISAGDYGHTLDVELFAIGQEHMGNRFILLSRCKSHFVPSETNRSFVFSSDKKLTIYTTDLFGDVRGTDYYGYLVVVTDERGKIIQHAESNKWLFDVLDNLRKLPAGRYMDKTGQRVFPTSPRPTKY